MGDPYRSLALAEYVHRYYSPPLRIADVAGGSGALNDVLSRRGFTVVTIDPKLRFKDDKLEGIATEFQASMAQDFDLVVGLHPDGATEQITSASKIRPVILVPCCRIWEGTEMRATHSIRGTLEAYLKREGILFYRELLDISGPNVVYRTTRLH